MGCNARKTNKQTTNNPVCTSFKLCLTLKEKYKLGTFTSRVLRTTFESRRGGVNGGRGK
jgi:hypothetical protein